MNLALVEVGRSLSSAMDETQIAFSDLGTPSIRHLRAVLNGYLQLSGLTKYFYLKARMNPSLTFKILSPNTKHYSDAITLCEEVFNKIIKPNTEPHTQIAAFLDGKVCAAVTLIREENLYKLQNLAVRGEMQSKGIGSMLLKFCEEFVLEEGVVAIYSHAPDAIGRSAVNFFLKNEYFCRGEVFDGDGVANQVMVKLLVGE